MAHFELLKDKPLGEGSFGSVYQCRWHGIIAAAKQFNVAEVNKTSEVSQEIKMIEKLRNDYIIQFFGTAQHDGKICLITSYAENGSLYQALAHQMISEEQKPKIITGLIQGLLYLKRNNVVHRDLKSPNVLLDKNYAPKICDFGLARLKINSATHIETSVKPSQKPKGTLRWMAPELLQRKPRYSFASDVYALGIVIWEILTEKFPYAEIKEYLVVRNCIKEGIHDAIPDSIPEHYKSIINGCRRMNPNDRITLEDIRKVNEDVLPEVGAKSVDSVFYGISNQAEQSEYENILTQCLQSASKPFADKDLLASILTAHGNDLIQRIQTAAREGDDAATIVLGFMHFHGCGVPQDYQSAFEQFSTAAMDETSDQSNSETAIYYKKNTKQGNAFAQFCIGRMYMNGQGVPQSDDKAVEWYTKAAEQGDSIAQFILGSMHLQGRGVPQSDDKAVEWYTKAAEQGNEIAQNNLGQMYRSGRGVPQSDDKAVEWYTKAAEQGNARAQFNLGSMHLQGRGVPHNED